MGRYIKGGSTENRRAGLFLTTKIRKAPPGTDFFRAIFERSSNSRQRTGTAFERDVWRSRALASAGVRGVHEEGHAPTF